MRGPLDKSSLLTRWCVLLLLSVHLAVSLLSKREHGMAFDEPIHLVSGLSYSHYGDYRLQPENGNLPQRWAALPALLAEAQLPALSSIGYNNSSAWAVDREFRALNEARYRTYLAWGRAMIGVFSLATGLLVFFWSRSLFGPQAGLFSLLLYCLNPEFLAHGTLVTSDITATCCMLGAVWSFWTCLHAPRLSFLVASGGLLGLACVAKFSAVLLLPVFFTLVAVRSFHARPFQIARWNAESPKHRFLAGSLLFIAHALLAWLVIWCAYGFRFSAFAEGSTPESRFIIPWLEITSALGWKGALLDFCHSCKVLPEAFLYGFAYVIKTTDARSAFLDGAYSAVGWTSFFPKSFLYKTPASLLLLLALCLVPLFHALRSTRKTALSASIYAFAPLICFSAVFWAAALGSRLNIGHRHILPLYVPLFIVAGCLLKTSATPPPLPLQAKRRPIAPWLCWTLAGVCCIESLLAFPNYLSFFNVGAGGVRGGWRHLVDSSSDWGQDLPRLAKRLRDFERENPSVPVYLSYFGTDSPPSLGIKAKALRPVGMLLPKLPLISCDPGLYCLSGTTLQLVYGQVKGPWTSDQERAYQQMRKLEPLFVEYERSSEVRAHINAIQTQPSWEYRIDLYDKLRFARLCHYLRARGPDEMIGGSILLFHLNAAELHAALDAPLPSALTNEK